MGIGQVSWISAIFSWCSSIPKAGPKFQFYDIREIITRKHTLYFPGIFLYFIFNIY